MESDEVVEPTETKKCRPCEIGLAVVGLFIAAVFAYVAIDVLTGSGLTSLLFGGTRTRVAEIEGEVVDSE